MKTPIVAILITIATGCFFEDKENQGFPSFGFLLKDSVTVFNSEQIPNDKPFVMIYFSPDCKDCQEETKGILDHMEALKNVNFYFLTNDSFDRLKVFENYFRLYNYKNIVLGWDNQFGYIKYFHPTGTPYSILFDKNKWAQAVFAGTMQPEHLLSKLKSL